MERSNKGEAISARGRSPSSRKKLRKFIAECEKSNRLDEWRRARGVLGYIEGRTAAAMAAELGVSRVTVGRWLQWYEADALNGLVTVKAPGRPRHLNDEQRAEIATMIDAGPQEAGFSSGVWTGPMIGNMIQNAFGVTVHKQCVPRLLHELGYSLQRPRKRLARADIELQKTWIRKTFPAIKKSA